LVSNGLQHNDLERMKLPSIRWPVSWLAAARPFPPMPWRKQEVKPAPAGLYYLPDGVRKKKTARPGRTRVKLPLVHPPRARSCPNRTASQPPAAINHHPSTPMPMKHLTETGSGMAAPSIFEAVRPDRTATSVWMGRINVWMRDGLCARIPEGFEDEDGFHYGPAGSRGRTWPTPVPSA
jgi:hypothetical protein